MENLWAMWTFETLSKLIGGHLSVSNTQDYISPNVPG